MLKILASMRGVSIGELYQFFGRSNTNVKRPEEITSQYAEALQRIPLLEAAIQKPLNEFQKQNIAEALEYATPLPEEFDNVLNRLPCYTIGNRSSW